MLSYWTAPISRWTGSPNPIFGHHVCQTTPHLKYNPEKHESIQTKHEDTYVKAEESEVIEEKYG